MIKKYLLVALFVLCGLSDTFATSVFTYQGQLIRNERLFTGQADFSFRLFDAEVEGEQVGPVELREGLPVSDGLFRANLDFGQVFDGTPLWLEVRVNDLVLPRQLITAVPFAANVPRGAGSLWSGEDGNNVGIVGQAVGIGTTEPTASLQVIGNFISGDQGSAISATNSAITGGIGNEVTGSNSSIAGGFQVSIDDSDSFAGGGRSNLVGSGASGIVGGLESVIGAGGFHGFIGGGRNHDIQAQDSGIVGGIVHTIEAAAGGAGFIGGGAFHTVSAGDSGIVAGVENSVAAGRSGFIGGGFKNDVSGEKSATVGGRENRIGPTRSAFIGGGFQNEIRALDEEPVIAPLESAIIGGIKNFVAYPYSAIVAGTSNKVTAASAVIVGGRDNSLLRQENAEDAFESLIGGGYENAILAAASAIVGGGLNEISSDVNEGAGRSFIGAGLGNSITRAQDSGIVAGINHVIDSGGAGFIGGGAGNRVSAGDAGIVAGVGNEAAGPRGFVAGGMSNAASAPDSFAAGVNAKALHESSFVWADRRLDGDGDGVAFETSAPNQFLIRAGGGVGIGINAGIPSDGLAVQGVVEAQGFNTRSSAALKKNIQKLEVNAAALENIRPVSFTWRDSGEADIGLIVEEVAEYLPDFVTFDDNDNPQSIAYHRLISALILSQQQLQAQNENLRAELEGLHSQVQQLQASVNEQESVRERLVALERLFSGDVVAANKPSGE